MEYEFKQSDKNIIEIVSLIKMRSEMFFGNDEIDIHRLYYYLLGFNGARLMHGISDKFDQIFQSEFNTWVYKKFEHLLDHNTNWADSIFQVAKEMNVAPSIIFFELFDDFFSNELKQ